jgi:GrpB-like predicted nucleotidyltransferase (UPF0157 family)
MMPAAMFTIEESIKIVPYHSIWPAYYEAEKPLLQSVFAQRLRGIEHIGSTSVVGLAAKPIVDIMIGLPDLMITIWEQQQLLLLGYEYFGQAGVPGRLYARKRGRKNYNLQIVCYEEMVWFNNLAIRDYLRAHPTEAAVYAALKYAIVKEGIRSLLAYTEHKYPFMRQLRQRAGRWYSRAFL